MTITAYDPETGRHIEAEVAWNGTIGRVLAMSPSDATLEISAHPMVDEECRVRLERAQAEVDKIIAARERDSAAVSERWSVRTGKKKRPKGGY